MIDRDKLHSGHPSVMMRNACFKIVDAGQDEPAVQVLATALALTAMCEALNVNVRDLLVTCERMKNDLDGPYVGTFSAITEYARKEIGGM